MEAFRQWEDVKELLNCGALKHSNLERALAKVGALDGGDIRLDQFRWLTDLIQDSADANKLSDAYERKLVKQQNQSEKSGAEVLQLDDDDEDENSFGLQIGDEIENGGIINELTEVCCA